MTARVSIRNVSRKFGDFTALNDVSLDIDAGEFIVLLGPSGCGKTTLLSILGGFLSPTAGSVTIGDRDMTHVPPARRPTTTMFQDYALFPHMSLRDNVAFGPRMRGMPSRERHRKAHDLLRLVGLEASAARKPHELSGGQRQRVALARALAVDPDVLLLDEPLGALDLKLRREMQDELKAIQRRVGTTFVHVTHDQEEAMAIADRIVVMNHGHIEDTGTPADVYMRPRSLFSASFMGEINLIAARSRHAGASGLLVDTQLGPLALPEGVFGAVRPAVGEELTLCIRPENFRTPDSGQTTLSLGRARVIDCAFFGTHYRCHLRAEGAQDLLLIVHLSPSANPVVGEVMDVTLDASRIVALRSGSGRV